MFENTTLEQYSVLKELSSVTPVWRPFVHHAEHASDRAHVEVERFDEPVQ